MAKLPAFQFYPGDWLKDSALRRCSATARGAWIDILCLMFECDNRGILRTNRHPWSPAEAAKVVGVPVRVIDELIKNSVIRVSPRTKTMWSKRMVFDERIRRVRAVVGSRGGLNRSKKRQAKYQANPKQTLKQKAPPSSSSSTSSSEVEDKGTPRRAIPSSSPPTTTPIRIAPMNREQLRAESKARAEAHAAEARRMRGEA
jgi:hypothetical protein